MARYIDADKLIQENSEIIDCEINHPRYEDTLRDLIENIPSADVVEREKIDKARKEIQSELFIKAETRYMKGFNDAINICLRNLDKLIESESAE